MEKVLIVDDNSIFRELIRETLHSRLPSLNVAEARDRKEALKMIQASPPDLIFTEIRLPDGSGLELSRQVKRLSPSVRIVILTNYDEPYYRDAAYRLKVDHYVTKATFMSICNVELSLLLSNYK
jgi:DNA-binding NarL/FixJ family response regulator